MIRIVKMIQWLSIIFGAFGAIFSAYMHFKIQNAAAVVPVKAVEEKPKDKVSGKIENNKVTIHELLDPVKLTNQNETRQVPKKTENK